jgi:hypothetical protein
MEALSGLLALVQDMQRALSRGLPTGDFGPLIELLDGPRQRRVQAAAVAELVVHGALIGAPAMAEDFE